VKSLDPFRLSVLCIDRAPGILPGQTMFTKQQQPHFTFSHWLKHWVEPFHWLGLGLLNSQACLFDWSFGMVAIICLTSSKLGGIFVYWVFHPDALTRWQEYGVSWILAVFCAVFMCLVCIVWCPVFNSLWSGGKVSMAVYCGVWSVYNRRHLLACTHHSEDTNIQDYSRKPN
jgi:hypothetical protein